MLQMLAYIHTLQSLIVPVYEKKNAGTMIALFYYVLFTAVDCLFIYFY